MAQLKPEIEKAWEELSFWREFAIWWKTARSNVSEPRLVEILEKAERRYVAAQQKMLPATAHGLEDQ